jgi:hypothetical protein
LQAGYLTVELNDFVGLGNFMSLPLESAAGIAGGIAASRA